MTLVYACGHVVRSEREAALVVHHSDDTWQVMCGEADHDVNGEDIFPIHLQHLSDRQADLGPQARALPKGYLAERIGGGWKISAHDD